MSSAAHSIKKLGWFLCWAIVFADIGTSLYYVPGILYGEVGKLSGLFVMMSSLVFVLLVLKYIEITDRYSEGGGVVTVATHAFGPWFGALGGMFITVDYFLTASISSVSGFAYLASIFSQFTPYILVGTIVALIALGLLNVIGIKESAGITAIVAVAAFIVDIIVLAFVTLQVRPEGWQAIISSLGQVSTLTPIALLTGFAGSFLAFSGLESISQLSPAMQTPRKKVATKTMIFVVIAIFLTSPLLTIFATNLLDAKTRDGSETILDSVANIEQRQVQLESTTDPVQKQKLSDQIEEGSHYSESFISELGAQYGGDLLKVAVVATASVLLIFASNTAIIGAYHVFSSLSRQRFLPEVLQHHNAKFGTPHWAVALAVLPPIVIVIATQGDVSLLGQLYAFGLLGAFGLSSLGLDIVRWREQHKISLSFVVGLITTGLVFLAWGTNIFSKPLATVFGGTITIIGMLSAFVIRKYINVEKVTETPLAVAKAAYLPKKQILVPVFDEFDPKLFDYVATIAHKYEKQIVLLYVRQFTDILQTVSEDIKLDGEAAKFIKRAKTILDKHKVINFAIYKTGTSTADIINELRGEIKPMMTIMSPHKQSALVDFLKGDIIHKVIEYPNGDVLIYTGKK